jgi:hypothetical protein
LAQQSASAPPQVTQLLGQAMSHMREGVRSYERGNISGGRMQGEEAYSYLNRAVIELNRALPRRPRATSRATARVSRSNAWISSWASSSS